jgi:MFS superfamily sulfate permease-like transporter
MYLVLRLALAITMLSQRRRPNFSIFACAQVTFFVTLFVSIQDGLGWGLAASVICLFYKLAQVSSHIPSMPYFWSVVKILR